MNAEKITDTLIECVDDLREEARCAQREGVAMRLREVANRLNDLAIEVGPPSWMEAYKIIKKAGL